MFARKMAKRRERRRRLRANFCPSPKNDGAGDANQVRSEQKVTSLNGKDQSQDPSLFTKKEQVSKKRRTKQYYWWKRVPPQTNANSINRTKHSQDTETLDPPPKITNNTRIPSSRRIESRTKNSGDGRDKKEPYDAFHHSLSPATKTEPGKDDSHSEESSLLQLHSFSYSDEEEDDEDDAVRSEYKGFQRLKRKLHIRRQRLLRLCEGRRSSYVKLLQANDDAARAISLAIYMERHSISEEKDESSGLIHDDSDNKDPCYPPQQSEELSHRKDAVSRHSTSSKDLDRGASTVVRLWWMVLFEYNLTLPSFFTVMIVLLGHTTFYCTVDVLLKSLYYNVFENLITFDQFVVGQILLGLSLIRVNGNIFYWLSPRDYNLVRLEMQNRLSIRSRDAQFLKRIKGSVLSSAFNMFGYYFASIGVFHFYSIGQQKYLQPFEEWYVKVFLEAGGSYNSSTGQEVKQECHHLVETVDAHDDLSKWLIHYFCTDSTMEWRALVIVYHGLCLAVTAVLAAALGQNLLTFCD